MFTKGPVFMMQNDHFKVIGITGGIGSGKSRVLEYLSEKEGCYILESDKLAHRLMSKECEAYDAVVAEFGRGILSEETGEIDRRKLGGIVFNDNGKLQKLNDIVHPIVKKKILSMIDDASKGILLNDRGEKINLFIIEAAVLIEDGYSKICDAICYIHTDTEVRIKRLGASRGLSREKSLSVINSQSSDEFYRENSDYIIDNSSSFEDTIPGIDSMILNLKMQKPE